MKSFFDHWKYIVRNLWFVLPFAVMPAVFLALSVDFEGILFVARSFFTGRLYGVGFQELFRAWSFFRFDSALGVVYSVFALVCIAVFTSCLLSFTEKHMRIGKRTLSGVFAQFPGHVLSVSLVTLCYFFLYELWALALSAVLFAVCTVLEAAAAEAMFVFVTVLFMAALLYLLPVFYLWLPCMLYTGFRPYEAFLYSYRLMVGVRAKLILSMLLTYLPCVVLLAGLAFVPLWLSPILAFVMFTFAYLSFCVRMETLYFETDKLGREDLLRSYREL